MLNIIARNVNDAYIEVLHAFKANAPHIQPEPSRNGPVARYPTPVLVTYARPNERVLFDAYRDANPFFHLMEGIWMLAGRNDVAFPATFVKQIAAYSDDGRTIHGAYGHRWREHFGHDQIMDVVGQLLKFPNTRRAVIANFDPTTDGFDYQIDGGKDVPCNTHIYFAIREGALDMTVMARSNDMVWGALGANAVHMSMLHEVVAHGAMLPLGKMYQFSNDYHIYLDKYKPEDLLSNADRGQPYRQLEPLPLVTGDYVRFLNECEAFCDAKGDYNFTEPFLKFTAKPMANAYLCYKAGDAGTALQIMNSVVAPDWALAGREWIKRHADRANR